MPLSLQVWGLPEQVQLRMETLRRSPVQLEINHLLAGVAAGGGLRNEVFGLNSTVPAPVTITKADPQTFFAERKKKNVRHIFRGLISFQCPEETFLKASAASTPVSGNNIKDFETETQCDSAKVNKTRGRREMKKHGSRRSQTSFRKVKEGSWLGAGQNSEFKIQEKRRNTLGLPDLANKNSR